MKKTFCDKCGKECFYGFASVNCKVSIQDCDVIILRGDYCEECFKALKDVLGQDPPLARTPPIQDSVSSPQEKQDPDITPEEKSP